MSTEENKRVIRRFWASVVAGDLEETLSFIDEDARLQTIGDLPICGQRTKKDFVEAMLEMSQNFDGAGEVRLGELIAERDIVVAEVDSIYKTKDGETYNNQYVYVYYLRDGKIVGMKEHADTLHTYEKLANRLTRGPRIERLTNIWRVDSEFEGDCGSRPETVPQTV